MNIVQKVFESNKARPEQIAFKDEYGSMSYGEFSAAVLGVAEQLKAVSLEAGMGVGVMDKNSRHFIITVFAVMLSDAVAMPISHQLKEAEINKELERSGLHWLIDSGNGPALQHEVISELNIANKKWQLRLNKKYDGQRFASHVAEPAIMRYTSGTTGTSKGVIIGHQSIEERIDAANKALNLGTKDTVVWVLPMAYHFVVSIILYLKYGCTIALVKDFLGDTIYNCIEETKGTFLYASPMHIKMLNNLKVEALPPSLTKVISTSTAISRVQGEKFIEKYKLPIWQAYGIIEIGLPAINTIKALEQPDAIGHGLPDYEIGILSDDFELLPTGEIGNFGIKGPGMFDAYLEPPTLRADVLQQGWFMTGDLASITADGVIKIEGRKKSMINVAGNKVFPFEVEEVLAEHEAIVSSKVSAFTHRLMGEIVQAEIVLEEGVELSKEAIISFCRERLSTYKLPQRISFVKEHEYTGSGKIKRS